MKFPRIFCIHLLVTLMMLGVIWFVQIVHYPLFSAVSEASFVQYEELNVYYTGLLVAPLMVVELLTAIFLWAKADLPCERRLFALGLGLVIVIWGVTFFVQVPLHEELQSGFELNIYESLVAGNWIRTILWSMRGGLLLAFVSEQFSAKLPTES